MLSLAIRLFDNDPHAVPYYFLTDLLEVYIKLRGPSNISEHFIEELKEATTTLLIPRDNKAVLEIQAASAEVKSFVKFAHQEFKDRCGYRHYSELAFLTINEHTVVTPELILWKTLQRLLSNQRQLKKLEKMAEAYTVNRKDSPSKRQPPPHPDFRDEAKPPIKP